MYVFLNGAFIDETDAALNIADLSIQRGFGLFDFFRTSNHVPLFLDNYLDRFFRSCSVLDLHPSYSREALKQIIFDLIERNKIETSGIKMIVTGGYSSDSFEPGKPNFIITQQPVKIASEEEFEKGVRIMLYDYLRDVPTAKSINYLMAVYLQKTLAQKNAGDVLYCNNNRILEFPRSNVFIVTPDKRVVTPLDDVLHGITRKKVLEIAGKEYQAEQRAISVEELKRASEVFLTSTTKRLLPVLAIDDHVVGDGTPGEITRKLCKEFIELEKIYCAKQSVGS